MKIDFLSDLHFEINSNVNINWPEKRGDILILDGDILPYRYLQPHRTDAESRSLKKRFTKFLTEGCAPYWAIFWVPGNHEYYGSKWTDNGMPEIMMEIDPRVKILNDDWVMLHDIIVYGATFWTDFNRDDPLAILAVEDGMNDYRVIYTDDNKKQPLRGYLTQREHNKCREHIGFIYENNPDKQIVIATHHGPSMQSHDPSRFGDNALKYGYLSDLDEMIESWQEGRVPAWIHGHTHSNVDYKIGSTRVLSAMYGYLGHDRPFKDVLDVGQIEV